MNNFKFPIYVCEDNAKQRDWLTHLIRQYVMIEDLPMELVCSTGDPQVLLDTWAESRQHGLFFLDIDLQAEIDGLDLARRIRDVDSLAILVFVTTREDYIPLTFDYQVMPLDFIPKDDPEVMARRIKKALSTYAKRQLKDGDVKQVFSFKQGSREIALPYNQIQYLATAGQAHVIELTTDNSRYQFYHKSMKQIMDSLGDPFIKLSQSEIVNIDKVQSYHPIEKTLTVQNGDKLTIAQRLYGKISRTLKARNIPTEKD